MYLGGEMVKNKLHQTLQIRDMHDNVNKIMKDVIPIEGIPFIF
jgi:MinD-like ATPase involved in chromosome partitioning or flagellar assembly